jgi:tetratricopeptide (TPR) repeat protein
MALLWGAILLFSCNGPERPKEENAESLVDSLAALNQSIAKDSLNAGLYAQRGAYFLKRKDAPKAYLDYKKALSLDSLNEAILYDYAEVAFLVNRTRESRDAFLKCTEINPKNPDPFLRLAELHYYVREYLKALGYLDQAQLVKEKFPRAYFLRGMIYKEGGDTARAFEAFRKAIETDQEFYDAFMQLGLLHSARKEPIALQYFDNVLNLDAKSTEALYGKAWFFQQIDSVRQAEKWYNAILLIDSVNLNTLFNMGYLAYYFHKDFRTATVYFAKCIKYRPNDADAYYMRGLSFEQLGEYRKSNRDYLEAVRIDPGYKEAFDGIKRIERK